MQPFTVSNHSLGIILSCQRAGYFYKVRRRIKAVEEKPGADAGSALHEALARYYKGASMTEACVPLLSFQNGDDFRHGAYLAEALRAYEKHWGDDRNTFKVVASELPFEIKLTDNILWQGRIDLVYRHPDGRLVIRDFKSSKTWGNIDLDRFAQNPGQKGYCYAATQLLGQEVCTSEIDALVIRPPLQGAPRKDGLPRFEFHRAQFLQTREITEEWRLNVIRVVEAFLKAVEDDAITTNENSCVQFGGRCPYYDCCTQPTKAQREMYLSTDFFTDYVPRVAATD